MADKRLVVTDVDPNSSEYGAMLAIAPGSATALAIPAFRTGASTPPAGSVVGEGFINLTTRSAMVWDGAQWSPIVAGALIVYPTDADVIADANAPTGSYATSQASGNLFVKGAAAWRQIGVRNYPTAAALLADTAPDGSLGVAEDEETFWIMHGGVWHCHSRRVFPTVTDLASWVNPPEGSMAMETAEELRYHFHSGAWQPESIWSEIEADILADADRLDGQMAVASDTGHVYVWHSGRWMSSQVQHYATEVDLQNDSPNNGVLAWADDTGLVYARAGGNWIRVNSPTVTVNAAVPPTPAAGDLHLDPVTGDTTIFDGSTWRSISGTQSPIGTIIMYPNMTPPPGYLLCNGASIDQNRYPQLHALFSAAGGKLPDLTDQFVRGATSNSDVTGSVKHLDTTRRPRNHAFTGSTNWAGTHWHTLYKIKWHGLTDGGGYSDMEYQNSNNSAQDTQAPRTNDSGNHVHTVSINGGGDNETAPKHVRLAYMIKHD